MSARSGARRRPTRLAQREHLDRRHLTRAGTMTRRPESAGTLAPWNRDGGDGQRPIAVDAGELAEREEGIDGHVPHPVTLGSSRRPLPTTVPPARVESLCIAERVRAAVGSSDWRQEERSEFGDPEPTPMVRSIQFLVLVSSPRWSQFSWAGISGAGTRDEELQLGGLWTFSTALVSGWAGSMALYKLAVFDASDSVLDLMWRQDIFVIPFMTRLGITNSWGGWSISEGTVPNPGNWSYEGVAGAVHILCFLACVSWQLSDIGSIGT
jgi:hypothetical protein